MKNRVPVLLTVMLLAMSVGACGRVGSLERTKDMTPLPVAVGASRAATPEELMQPSTQSRPARNGDVLDRSERRREDSFDKRPGADNGRYPASQD
ncbi:MAG: hypothetical protein QM690_21765 [Sphingobium sp.]